ncbi:hypothetical protein SAMN02745704_01906 [Paucidesulfovibrio gracilis DSM 16080]|uniref:Uncharacterized protein n=1 Tax=Paucidesulfovibrio gracilis DSM 16080 TaxID=1121449 RepID=A0A1T4X950_9BACT|nr:hypothetical protein [Paucidesulfovibrio gracilis]SKA85625.1 hypothetical protein SAMN02745704_01906 [Paucidesulfovibrio gracilis DSM 16080]
MKKFFSFLLFAAIIVGAVSLAPTLGQKLDKPYEAGLLQAPDIERHNHAAPEHEAGHGEPAESHG